LFWDKNPDRKTRETFYSLAHPSLQQQKTIANNKKPLPTQVDNVVWQRRPFQMAGTLGIIH
jgi:hypothetical protein